MLTRTREPDLCLCLCVECFRAGVHSRTQDLRQEVDQVSRLRWQSRISYQDNENTTDWGNCLVCTDVPLGKILPPPPPRVCHVEKLLSTIKTNCAMHQIFREREYLWDCNLESVEGRQEEAYCLSVSSNIFISYSSWTTPSNPLWRGKRVFRVLHPSCNMLNIRGTLDPSQSSKGSGTQQELLRSDVYFVSSIRWLISTLGMISWTEGSDAILSRLLINYANIWLSVASLFYSSSGKINKIQNNCSIFLLRLVNCFSTFLFFLWLCFLPNSFIYFFVWF